MFVTTWPLWVLTYCSIKYPSHLTYPQFHSVLSHQTFSWDLSGGVREKPQDIILIKLVASLEIFKMYYSKALYISGFF